MRRAAQRGGQRLRRRASSTSHSATAAPSRAKRSRAGRADALRGAGDHGDRPTGRSSHRPARSRRCLRRPVEPDAHALGIELDVDGQQRRASASAQRAAVRAPALRSTARAGRRAAARGVGSAGAAARQRHHRVDLLEQQLGRGAARRRRGRSASGTCSPARSRAGADRRLQRLGLELHRRGGRQIQRPAAVSNSR